MAIQKRPYELSVWVEKLNGSNSKIEEKGVIIGAHDMSYPGKATNIVLKREIKGTNTLTFQLPDRYFDSLKGDFVRNEFADLVAPEAKLKLFYKDRWFEFFVKKVDDKKQFKSYMKSFTCTDAFIDELSRNGYGITYDTELNNNVEEIGVFTEETLEDSIWQYHPENNWGDFTEYKEEKLYRIPISCFGGSINGYKLNFELEQEQCDEIKEKTGTDFVKNVFTGDSRPVELSDDLARGYFWDEYVEGGTTRNALTKEYHTDIPNDGYIYVPYSCLGFCYGTEEEPDFTDKLKYDRAATETAIAVDGKLILAPQSVDPRTIIQFYAIPKTGILELDDGGVIMNKDYTFFMTLADWNNAVQGDKWYIFEDTRLVQAEALGSADVQAPSISHTFKYKSDKANNIDSLGNKYVIYDGYLCDVNENSIVKGKKFSITNRTEVNISEEIDQYTTVYNAHADDFVNEYSSEDWEYQVGEKTKNEQSYRVCSKLETRQIIPQLARNLVQNGTDMDSTDGWSPMSYLLENSIFITPTVTHRGVSKSADEESISTSALVYQPAAAKAAEIFQVVPKEGQPGPNNPSSEAVDNMRFSFSSTNSRKWSEINDCTMKTRVMNNLIAPLRASQGFINIYSIGLNYYFKSGNDYKFLFAKGDAVQRALLSIVKITDTKEADYIAPDNTGKVHYTVETASWEYREADNKVELKDAKTDSKDGDISANNGQEIVNFGIIGQDKKIEKDKIYCLGVSACFDTDFKIKIGKGALISDGEYIISEENQLVFDCGPNGDIIIDHVSMPENLNDEKKNLIIPEIPDTRYILFKTKKDIENPYFVISSAKKIVLLRLYLFEAYTKGIDAFPNTNGKLQYHYSGRNLFWAPKKTSVIDKGAYERTINTFYDKDVENQINIRNMIIFEDDIMLGSTYGYQHYYIQRLKTKDEEPEYYDTMGAKAFISSDPDKIGKDVLPLDAAAYTEDDYEIQTNYIDLNKCSYYDKEADLTEHDCKYGNGHTCFYQKFGYCPFRFPTEKHDRRIRTLSINKSNRFNIIQQTSKVFEVYPQFYIEHKSNGSVIKDENDEYLKKVFYIKEKGKENKIGFRYEKNLKDISRSIVSDKIVTKLYVLDVDSDLSKTGLCSIKTAEDNPSKDSFIIDMSYYIEKGMLDGNEVEQDLYGITPNEKSIKDNPDEIPSGFLQQLGYYNTRYDELSNKIINLQDASFTELQANLEVNYQGIITAQEQILKIRKQLDKYKNMYSTTGEYETQQAYLNFKVKLAEQEAILTQLIYSTFYTNGECDLNENVWKEDCFDHDSWPPAPGTEVTAIEFFNHIKDLEESRKYWIDLHSYTAGILGQFNREYLQIQQWKRERASYLKLINQISTAFYKKYEPYLKEGTWSDSNYLSDNAYYFGALDVAADGAIPKVSYTISVIDLAPLNEEYEDIYDFDLADTTYVEDIGMFGINKHTGFPNRLKVLISAVQEGLDDPSKDTISVQNFTTSFQDLFQQVTASVQSLTYNENIYKRSSNFTSLQNITNSSLQGALDTNDLTLLDTDENNIQVDNTGTSGSDINNHANKYVLNGQGLFFSNDGGQHWSVGVGPSGINADYIKVGTLDAGKIRIADSAYIYFSWDKDGIVAYRDPQALTTDAKNINDAAIFNKYGLSIVADGNIKLRAGYSFNNENSGLISEEDTLGDEIGFYLYNNNGEPIFQTTASSNGDRESAIIKLIGEMMVSNTLAVQKSGGDKFTDKVRPLTYGSFGYATPKEIPNWHTSSETDEETQITTYYFNATGNEFTNDLIATYLFGNEPDKTSIEIRRDSSVTTYTKSGVTTVPLTNVYLGTDESHISQKVLTKYGISVNKSGQTVTNYYFNIGNIHGNNAKKYFINNGGDFVANTSITFYNGVDSTAAPVYGNGITQTLYYWEETGNVLIKKAKVVYVLPEGTYASGEAGGGTPTSVDSTVGLYLNNPSMSDINATGHGNQRLLVCCVQNGDKVSNLFAVTKDGTVSFGGTIEGETNAANLSDKITIPDAKMLVDSNGNLFISFSSIVDPNTHWKLDEYIANEISNSSGPIYEAIDGAVNNMRGEIEAAVGGIEGFHDHVHNIDWKRPSVKINTPGGAATVEEYAADLKVKIQSYATTSGTSGSDDNWVKLGDLFEIGGVR